MHGGGVNGRNPSSLLFMGPISSKFRKGFTNGQTYERKFCDQSRPLVNNPSLRMLANVWANLSPRFRLQTPIGARKWTLMGCDFICPKPWLATGVRTSILFSFLFCFWCIPMHFHPHDPVPTACLCLSLVHECLSMKKHNVKISPVKLPQMKNETKWSSLTDPESHMEWIPSRSRTRTGYFQIQRIRNTKAALKSYQRRGGQNPESLGGFSSVCVHTFLFLQEVPL